MPRLYHDDQPLRYANGFFDTIDFEPAAKAVASEMIANDQLFEREGNLLRKRRHPLVGEKTATIQGR